MPSPLVSIVVPTYNSEKTLPLCLESIGRQTYREIEVLVVDNFSRDRTVEIAKAYGARVIQERSERTRAKNIGLRESRGKYVLFIDSDMELTPRVVEECVELAESDPRVAGIIIPERSRGSSFWVRVRDFERQLYANTLVESPRFFNRDIALKVGGFDESLVFYEEATLPYRIEKLGFNVRARIRSFIIHHEEDFSLSRWLLKKYYYGKTLNLYLSKYRSYAIQQANPLYRLRILVSRREFWRHPYLSAPLLFLKLMEFAFTEIGVLTASPI